MRSALLFSSAVSLAAALLLPGCSSAPSYTSAGTSGSGTTTTTDSGGSTGSRHTGRGPTGDGPGVGRAQGGEPTAEPSAGSGQEPFDRQRVFFATERKQIATEPMAFGILRNDDLQYGYTDVSIPPSHKVGRVERPYSIVGIEIKRANPSKHMTIVSARLESLADFQNDLNASVLHSKAHEGLIFIHGFNVSWASAVLRTAQLAHDLTIDGPSIAYDWPSAGRLGLPPYRSDQQNAELTATHLADFLDMISRKSGVTKLHVVAHSMGNYALALALKKSADSHHPLSNIHDIAMAAPDIDSAKFTSDYAALFRKSSGHLAIYMSSADKAMLISEKANGLKRLGDAHAITFVPGFDIIDASNVHTDILGHGYFAASSMLMTDLNGFFEGRPLPRYPLRAKTLHGATYYAFPAYASQ